MATVEMTIIEVRYGIDTSLVERCCGAAANIISAAIVCRANRRAVNYAIASARAFNVAEVNNTMICG
jgi:hypothetical protein